MCVHTRVSYGAARASWGTAGARVPAPSVLSDSLRSLSQFFPLEHLLWTEGRSGRGSLSKVGENVGTHVGRLWSPWGFPWSLRVGGVLLPQRPLRPRRASVGGSLSRAWDPAPAGKPRA